MTNYNERLDEIFAPLIDSPSLTLTTTYWGGAKQAITLLIKELVAEARIDGAIMGAKFGNAAFRQYNVAGKPMNLDEIRDVGIKQAEDWAKRQC